MSRQAHVLREAGRKTELFIRGTGIGDKTTGGTGSAELQGAKKRMPEKAAFPPQPQIELLREFGGVAGAGPR